MVVKKISIIFAIYISNLYSVQQAGLKVAEIKSLLRQIGPELEKVRYNERYATLTRVTGELASHLTVRHWNTLVKPHLRQFRDTVPGIIYTAHSVLVNDTARMIFFALLERQQVPYRDSLLTQVVRFIPPSTWIENGDIRVPPKFEGRVIDYVNRVASAVSIPRTSRALSTIVTMNNLRYDQLMYGGDVRAGRSRPLRRRE